MSRIAPLLLTLGILVSCGGAPAAAPSESPPPTPSATATSTVAATAGVLRIETAAGKSSATVRVREQLADRPAQSDAVLATSAVTGAIVLRGDGTFAEGSTITVDVKTLRSDNGIRDNFIQRTTLDTGRFPNATFTPKRAEGLPAPLPASGEWRVTLVGDLTIHGVTKEASWAATVKRNTSAVTGTATARFTFGDFGMPVPRVASVLSIVDDIRLEVEFVGVAAG